MITNFKLFEDRFEKEFLTPEEIEKFKEYITPHINDYLDKKIPKLKMNDFVSSNFNYKSTIDSYVFDKFFFSSMYRYVRDNISNASTPLVYNSFCNILEEIILDSVLGGQEPNIYMKVENRLVDIFGDDPELYKDYIKWYVDNFSYTLKEKLQYILDSEKYNL